MLFSVNKLIKINGRKLESTSKKIFQNIFFSRKPPNTCLKSVEYGRNHPDSNFVIINEEVPIERNLPITITENIHPNFLNVRKSLSPVTFSMKLDDGLAYGDRAIITSENAILSEVSVFFAATANDHPLCHRGNLPNPRYFPMSVAALASAGSDNYFHWLFDILPRIGLLDENCHIDKYYVGFDLKFQKQYLALLGISESMVIPAKRKSFIQAKQLVVPSLPGSTGNPSEYACRFLRRLADKISPGLELVTKKRVFISRKDSGSRRIAGEDIIFDRLKPLGFERTVLTGKSVSEQISLFKQAEVVIAPHGAGLSNIVYCDQGTKILEIFGPEYVNVCYWALAEQCDLEYYYLVSNDFDDDDDDGDSRPLGGGDTILNESDLQKMLGIMGISG